MILEQFPGTHRLTAAEKRIFAQELVQAADEEEGLELDPAFLQMLDQRLAEHAANPEAASPWIEVQQRVFGTRGY
jgi:putative addiction module component (TIGR02574 family)